MFSNEVVAKGTVWSTRFVLANTSCSLILRKCDCGTTQINRSVVKYWHSLSVTLLTDGDVQLPDRSYVSGLLTFIYSYATVVFSGTIQVRIFWWNSNYSEMDRNYWGKKKLLLLITLGSWWRYSDWWCESTHAPKSVAGRASECISHHFLSSPS